MATNPNLSTAGDNTAEIGQVIDARYRITGFLGDGGMGAVYRAEHVRLKRPVAVKLLHRDIAAQPGFRERFEREAVAAGQTQHENCVTVSDFGQLDDGTLFLVMELIAGDSLGDILADHGPLLPSRSLRVARDVLKGLEHAHAAGIVHRDVKPDNIILSGEGEDERAKLLDFGVAKLVGDAAALDKNRDLTQVGTTVGTPKYISPEQAFGKGVDPRSDLYSLSIVLFFMLAGKPPFEADEVIDLLMMHASQQPPTLEKAAVGRSFDPALNALIHKGLAKKADQRYADAREYIAAIDDILARLGPGLDKEPRAESAAPVAFDDTAHTPIPPVQSATDNRPTRALPNAPSQTVGVLGTMPSSVPRRYLWIGAGIAGIALLVVVLASGGDGDHARIAADEARKASAPGVNSLGNALRDTAASMTDGATALSKRAATQNDAGKFEEVKNLLQGKATPSGFERFELARAYGGTGDDELALAEYLAALKASPRLRRREAPMSLARTHMKHKSPRVRLMALELLVRYADAPGARKALVETASTSKTLELRQQARVLAEELGLRGELNLTRSYALDVTQEKSCEKRREALLRLRTLGDKRALPVFEKARYRMRGGIAGFGNKNSNKCLKEDAERAITELGGELESR